MFFPRSITNMTTPSWIDENYSCATRFSPPADHFHSETRGHFAFTWYRCEISYWSEILTLLQQPGEFTPVWFAPAWHFASSDTQGQLVGKIECSWSKITVRSGRALLDLKVNFYRLAAHGSPRMDILGCILWTIAEQREGTRLQCYVTHSLL